MRKLSRCFVAAVAACGVFAMTSVMAQQTDVLKAKGCLGCHDMDKKKVGPAFKDVAAKKQGKADELVAKIKDAKGHPKVNASEADIKAAVAQVLAATPSAHAAMTRTSATARSSRSEHADMARRRTAARRRARAATDRARSTKPVTAGRIACSTVRAP